MLKMSKAKLCLAILAMALAVIAGSLPAHAQDISQDSIKILQAQISALQKQLDEVKAAQAEAAAKAATATAASSAPGKTPTIVSEAPGELTIGGHTKVTVGGFLEAAGIYRSKNENADIGSSFNTLLPFAITGSGKGTANPNANQSEFRGTARQSRITALAEAKPNENTTIAAYVEADFLGAAQTANSNESNSYNPRMRVAYGTVDLSNCGLHFLAGQEWSLLTTNKVGINPRLENIPLTIDAQYVPGFNWTRNPQLRIVQDFDDHKIWVGISAESPQAILGGISAPSFVNATTASSGGLFNSANSYTNNVAPDIIAKVAIDPCWGHYEVFGITRFFHDYVLSGVSGEPANAAFGNNNTVGFAGGAAVILPVIPKMLDLQANFMGGQGIGRYGSVQLPDFAFTPTGDIKMLMGYTGMVGVVGHPDPTWDTYVYAGYEGVERANYANTSFGYGDYGLTIGNEQTSDVWQVTGGIWKRIYQGAYGKVQIGLQDSVTRRNAFGINDGPTQHAYENIFMTSFRFYPM